MLIPSRALRKDYIISKYAERKYAKRSSESSTALHRGLLKAIRSKDIFTLLQAYAEKMDLDDPVLEPTGVSLSLLWLHQKTQIKWQMHSSGSGSAVCVQMGTWPTKH